MNSSANATPWYTTLNAFISDQKYVLPIGIGFVVFFAVVRLYQMRDADGQKLPPSLPAKTFFLLTHVLLYLAIVLAFLLSPGLLREFAEITSGNAFEPFLKQIPLLAVVTSGILFSLPQAKDIERDYALFLHSVQHRTADEDRLCEHLIVCEFRPSDQERRLNENYLQQFNLYITERGDGPVRLGAFDAWRKVSAILRRLRDNDANSQRTLSGEDRLELARLEAAHQRKTSLAVSIIRILNDLGSEAENSAKLARITELLSSAAHADRESVLDAEVVAQTIIETQTSGKTNDMGKPLRISEQQILQYLSQIESYFRVEYKLILQRLSRMAAKSIVRAGELIGNRLEDLKQAGFAGLGTVEQVTFDRVIWVLLVTWVVTFVLFSMPPFLLGTASQRLVPIVLSVASTFSVAALIGAIWGSRRSLVERRITPWASYLAAGLLAVGGFFIVQAVRYVINPDVAVRRIAEVFKDEPATFVDYLLNLSPFALMPALITIGICRLARIREWPSWPLVDLPPRVKDGLSLGLLCAAANIGSRYLHMQANTAFAHGVPNQSNLQLYFPLAFFLIGFFIGLVVVGDVRSIAYSEIVPSSHERGSRLLAKKAQAA